MSRVALRAREPRPGRDGPRRRRRDAEGETESMRESARIDDHLEGRFEDSLTTDSADAWPRYMPRAAPGARRHADEGSEPLPLSDVSSPPAPLFSSVPTASPAPLPGAFTAAVSEAQGDESVDREEEAAGTAEAGVARRGFRWAAQEVAQETAQEVAQEVEVPPELIEQTETPLEAPPLQWQALSPDWQAPQALAADALPMPASASASATTQKPQAVQGRGKQGGEKQDEGRPAASNSDATEKKRGEIEARDKARRGYLDLVNTARSEQASFVHRANQITNGMAQACGVKSQEVLQTHGTDLSMLDAAAARACARVESAASLAGQALDVASQDTTEAIAAAGRSAYGLINADDTTAAARISTVVSGLVKGHHSAYISAIDAVTFAADDAVLALNAFRDERATNYPVDDPDPLEGAKNETRQARIPGWVEPVAAELMERTTAKTTEWDSTRQSTVCALTCSYADALETERTRVNEQGRASVAGALTRARATLRDQTRDGRKALRDLQRSYLTQIDTQRQAARSRLNSQARGTLMGLRQESQGAVGGVQGAARGAMPMYWRGAQGLEQSLRNSVNKGSQALNQTAEKAPPGILQSARRAGTQMAERLNGNLTRLEGRLSERRSTLAQQSGEQLAQFELTVGEQSAQATAQLDQSANGLVMAFTGIASGVSQAAAGWAQPLSVRLAGFITTKQGEAQAALTQVLTGQAPSVAGGGGGEGGGGEGGAGCGGCDSAAGGSSGPSAASASGGGGGSAPKGLTEQADDEIAYANERGLAEDFFAERLESTGAQVETNLETRSVNVAQKFEGGFAGSVDEEGVIAVLRGLTPAKGHALDVAVYPGSGGGTLDAHLQHYLEADSDDYATASAYLRGDAREGARRELADSTGLFNDDEARIEATMRALSPDDLAALGRDPAILEDVRGALDGTDGQVFDALMAGDYAAADAYRMRDAVDAARRDGNADAVHSAIEQYTGAPGENDWRSHEDMSADDRRSAVVAALGDIVSDADVARGAEAGADVSAMSAEDRAIAYVTRDIEVSVGGHGPEGQPHTVTLRMAGANRDLAAALLRHGENSLEARAARLGVEMQRTGDPPNATNIDRAMFDERFTPDSPNATPEERAANERHREAARRDRARVMLLAGHYAPAEAGGAPREPADRDAVMAPGFVPNADEVAAAQRNLIGGLRDRFGSDSMGADLAEGLLTDERPSASTASLAMQHALYSRSGTNEDLLFRFTERMNRDEIAAMRTQFQKDTGHSLDAELGVYGEGGTFTELSGDDRLRMERAMRGVARTDQERLENAAYALHQQRHETGVFGAWLAEGTLAERVMINTERRIERLAGGPIAFNRRGELTTALPNFAAGTGHYTGLDRDRFLATTAIAQTVAEHYAKRIDAFADVATTGIAILGAIAAAAITVATGGAAGPLIAAALVAGLASMAANAAIKGGRYGWEQAAVDLGMTAVQALTAGVGAQLGAAAQVASKGATAASAASRSLSTLARLFTGNPVVDQIIVGAITGSIGGMAGATFDERTWERSGGDAVSALFSGLLKGALSGAGTAALSNSVEALGRNGAAISARARELAARGGIGARTAGLLARSLGRAASGLDDALNATTTAGGGVMRNVGAVAARSVARGTVSSIGAVGGRTTEILYDSAAGKYRGDAGDALLDIGAAGRQAFIQGLGEGVGESSGARVLARTTRRTETAIASARADMGLPPMSPADLAAAAADLLFLNQHGRNGSDRLGRAIHLDSMASSGPLDAPIPMPHAPAPLPAADPAPQRTPLSEPEHKTAAQGDRQPQRVDVRFADDQLSITSSLIPELNRMSVPGTGRVHELPAPGSHGPGGSGVDGGSSPPAAGAAASIRGSGMRLAEAAQVTAQRGVVASATGEALRVPGLASASIHRPADGDGHVAVSLLDADGQPLRVKVVVADTEEGHVASFRPGGDGDGDFDFVVHLSPRAPLQTHARAVAHELTELRFHGHPQASGRDALRSGSTVDADARLSAHDRGRLAEMEVLAQRLAHVPDSDAPARAAWMSEIDALAAHLGLLHLPAGDPRLRLALGALAEGSAGRAALDASRARVHGDATGNALRPGQIIDPANPPPVSAADRARVAQLEELLSRLPPPASGAAEAPEVQAIRRQAEALAAELGLVFGQHSGGRRALAGSLMSDPAAAARLGELRAGALDNPLIQPQTGTPADVHLLVRQIEAAAAMGDHARAGQLAQIVGLHLEAAGAFAGRPAERAQAQRLMDGITDPALLAVLGDVIERHAARLEAPRLRAEAAGLRDRLNRMQQDVRPDGSPGNTPASAERQRRMDGLEARAAALEAEAGALERVASRPHQMTAEAARNTAPGDFTPLARVNEVPYLINSRDNAALVRQVYGDSPNFQGWRDFSDTRRSVNTGQAFNDVGMGRGGSRLDHATRARLDSYESSYARWVRGDYVDAETGRYNSLGDRRIVKPSGSTDVPTTARLDSSDTLHVPQRTVDPVSGNTIVSTLPMAPDAVASHRESLLQRRDALELAITALPEGSEARRALEAEQSRVFADLTQTSEALGVAAGRKVAAEQGLVEDPNLVIPRGGAGVPDLVYRDASGRIVVIECKGPRAGTVARVSESRGVPVDALQGTPEYLVSLAIEMSNSSDPDIRRLGRAILDEMPDVDYQLVKQTAHADETLGPIAVQRFDMSTPGR